MKYLETSLEKLKSSVKAVESIQYNGNPTEYANRKQAAVNAAQNEINMASNKVINGTRPIWEQDVVYHAQQTVNRHKISTGMW